MSNQVASAVALMGFVGLLFVIERSVALRRRSRPLWGRLLVNVGMSLLAFAVATTVVRPVAFTALQWGG